MITWIVFWILSKLLLIGNQILDTIIVPINPTILKEQLKEICITVR